MTASPAWPELPYAAWKDTYATLHLWTQIVGKIRLAQTPWLNHSWHVVLYVTARGLTTSPIPYGDRSFQLDFDFLDHVLRASTSDGASEGGRPLPALRRRFLCRHHARPCRNLASRSASMSCPTRSRTRSASARIDVHASYDRDYAERFWRILLQVERVLHAVPHRRFIGKCSPVHFFWGSFDLAVTRFSGRRAPPSPGRRAKSARRRGARAYSHEVSSAGFWPGGRASTTPPSIPTPTPAPPGFSSAAIRPARGLLERATSANTSCLTTQCAPPTIRSGADGISHQHLRGRRQRRELGSRRTRMSTRAAGNSSQGLKPVMVEKATRRDMSRRVANSPAQVVLALRCSFRPSLICSSAASVEGTLRNAFSSNEVMDRAVVANGSRPPRQPLSAFGHRLRLRREADRSRR